MHPSLAPALILATAMAGCRILPGAVPDWVANREPLESCGTEEAGLGEGIDPVARACLLEAFESGGSAELTSTMTSVEGDPITRIIRVLEDGTVEVFVDATRDNYGSGEWERQRCTALVPVAEFNDPPDLLFPEEYIFVEDGCEPMPTS